MSHDWGGLRPYQRDMLTAVRDAKAPRVIASMATGLGKGHVAGHLAEALGTERILYLAHRRELIDQLRSHVSRVINPFNIGVERAEERTHRLARCVIASVPTLQGDRLASMAPSRFDAIVTDEVHHATADSYRAIYRHFGALDADDRKVAAPRVRLVGLTATPSRGDGVGLHNVYDEIVYQYPIGPAIKDGWLVPVHAFQIESGISLDDVGTKGARGDYKDGELARAVNVDARNAVTFDACQTNAPGLRTLVFCADVEHAQAMAAHFTGRGVEARWVAGTMRTEERRSVLAWFVATPGAVLCNIAIVTEGVDIPGVECVCLARPTRSATLYAQILGRGTRLAKGAIDYDDSVRLGKSRCVLLDITDSIADAGKRAVRVGDIFGLPLPGANCNGRDVQEVEAEQVAMLAARTEARAAQTRAFSVDLFADAPIPDYCRLRWLGIGNGYRLPVPGLGTLRVSSDLLDRWNVEIMRKDAREWTPFVEAADTERAALLSAERHITAAASASLALLDRRARWVADPPSEKQLDLCRQLRIAVPDGATKGQVSAALDRHFAGKQRAAR